jgi:hypothetical protein
VLYKAVHNIPSGRYLQFANLMYSLINVRPVIGGYELK